METIEAIKARRAINHFDKERKVSAEVLEELLRIANLSPSSFNLQPWKVIVVEDPQMKTRLREAAMNQPKVEEASFVLVMVADVRAVEENQERAIEDRIQKGLIKDKSQGEGIKEVMRLLYGEKDSLKRKIFAVKNTAFFAMTLMIAAKGLGLETHPMDGFDEQKVKALFGLREDQIIPLLVAVGFPRPGLTLPERPFRRELKEFVSWY